MMSGIEKIKQKVATLGTDDENGWRVTLNGFGDRQAYNGDWLLRAAAAMAGIYGNSPSEAVYPLLAHRQCWRQARYQREPLHADFPGRRHAAGQGILVSDDVRR
jgi:hypothetical protein